MPGHDDVRAVGQRRPRRRRSASFTARSTPGSTSSTPLTCTPAACRRRSSARPCRDAATTSCWRRSSSCRWTSRPNHSGGSRKWIMQEAENSLRRLKTDYIDLYQVHRPERDDRRRGDPRRADRSRPPGQGPLHRVVLVLGQPDRRGAVGVPRAAPRPGSSPSSPRTRSWSAASRRTSSRRRSVTAWAPSCTARCPVAG